MTLPRRVTPPRSVLADIIRRATLFLAIITITITTLGLAAACSSTDDSDCSKNADDATRYVTVGFWTTTDCSGTPISTNAFPVASDAPCYCWPGHSGENSAFQFSCDTTANAFTYKQHTTLTCSGGNSNTKTVYTDKCVQDVPPTLYAKIIDFQACTAK